MVNITHLPFKPGKELGYLLNRVSLKVPNATVS
jgi:hypothetical protein